MLKFRASVAWHLPSRGPGLSCSRGGGRTPRLPGAMEPPGNGAFDPDDGLGERTLFDLPEEVVESVLSLLPHTDVCRFGSTCKQALVAARSETVWRALLWRDFAVKAPNGASRQSYSSLHADGQLWRTMQWRPVECGGPSQLLKLASAPDDALVIGTGERLRGCRPRHASSLISCAAPDLLPPDTLCSLFGGHHLLRRERRLPVGAPAQPERLHMLRGVPGPAWQPQRRRGGRLGWPRQHLDARSARGSPGGHAPALRVRPVRQRVGVPRGAVCGGGRRGRHGARVGTPGLARRGARDSFAR